MSTRATILLGIGYMAFVDGLYLALCWKYGVLEKMPLCELVTSLGVASSAAIIYAVITNILSRR